MTNRMRVFAILTLAALMGVAVTGCMASQSDQESAVAGDALPAYGVITPQQAAEVLLALQGDPTFVLLDIRTPAEVDAGHISGATELDYYSATFRDDLA
ncbi:rhodanese-like domain-containing protein, partial [Candidatus Bipolaricaulota bacterium]|nr:rhodanese-like domain-containing protein [Candidatus Bipolaricaulota bacterium]